MLTASLGGRFRWLESKPAGALRLAFRLPIYLYRLDLGWLLGHRFLLFAHLGRKSGLLRETVLEVILYDPATRDGTLGLGREGGLVPQHRGCSGA
jgi:hypothetical protein